MFSLTSSAVYSFLHVLIKLNNNSKQLISLGTYIDFRLGTCSICFTWIYTYLHIFCIPNYINLQRNAVVNLYFVIEFIKQNIRSCTVWSDFFYRLHPCLWTIFFKYYWVLDYNKNVRGISYRSFETYRFL